MDDPKLAQLSLNFVLSIAHTDTNEGKLQARAIAIELTFALFDADKVENAMAFLRWARPALTLN